MTDNQHKRSGMAGLRTWFFTGFVVLAPLAVTAYLAWSFIGWVDGWVKPYIPARYNPDTYLPFPVPGFGLIVALVGITLIGFLTANFMGRAIVRYGEYLLDQMPLVRNIYKGLKQILETVQHLQAGGAGGVSAQGSVGACVHCRTGSRRGQ